MSEKQLCIYKSIEDVNEGQWNNVVKQSGHGSIFHDTGWLRAVETELDRQARHVVLEKRGHPIAVMPNFEEPIPLPLSVPPGLDRFEPRRAVSLEPGFGGPLIMGDESSNFELLFDNVERLLSDRTLVYHRVKTVDDDFMRYGHRFAEHGYTPETTSCRFTIPLNRDWDEIESKMSKSKRSNLKDARGNSATVHNRTTDGSALTDFYETYETAMERVGGKVYPFQFFERLREQLPDRTKLFTVEVDGELAGGRLYLLDDERSSLRSFFQGLDGDFFNYHPSELLDEYVMKWGIEHGYDEYDLGSTLADFDDGAFRYKNELGAEIRPILSWEKGCSTFRWPVYRLGRQFVRSRA